MKNDPMGKAGMMPRSGILGLVQRVLGLAESVPYSILALIARLGVADVFWRSGQTKVIEGTWTLDPNTIDLFRNEYKVPVIPPEIAAYMATIQEHLFAVLLVIGLASRLSALGLLGMIVVIQLFVYPDSWPDHLLWLGGISLILCRGPGKISIDHFIRQKTLGDV